MRKTIGCLLCILSLSYFGPITMDNNSPSDISWRLYLGSYDYYRYESSVTYHFEKGVDPTDDQWEAYLRVREQ